jgi:glycosyltransferase EpsE
MEYRVSIIMGIYNCEATLDEAIQSVICQTYKNWELIMCDDGSTDDTYNKAKKYEKIYPNRIIVLRNKKNIRLAASLNRCLEVATGEYIARMDADDINCPNRLEEQVAYLKSHEDVACVGTGMIIFDEDGDRSIRLSKEYPNKKCMIHNAPFAHPTIMMRKKVFDELGGYKSSKDTIRAEDLELWFRFMAKGYKGYVIQKPLYRYRESIIDFQKRDLKAAIGTTKVFLNGYKLLDFPFYVYIFAFKPIISSLIPKKLMFLYHYKKDSRK